jgi:hypothetical protein
MVMLNPTHPDILYALLQQIVAAGDVLGTAGRGRTVLAVTIDDWLIDEMAAIAAEQEDMEDDMPAEDDDPAEDGEDASLYLGAP